MAPGLVAGTFSNTSTGQDRQISVNITTENSKPNIFVQTTFAALGVSSLLPWNSMITTLPFFLDRLNRTPFHDNFASWLTFSSTGAGLFAMGLATWSGSRFTNSSGFTVSISVLICLFAFLAAIPFIPLSASAFFVSTLLVNGLLAFAGGFLQTSTVTLASKYGPIATASYMFGSALVAVGISALQAVTAYTSADVETPYKDSLSWSATICFIVSVIILFLTLVLYRVLEKDIIPLSSVLVNIPPSERSHLIPQRPQPSLLRVPQVDPRRTYEASYSCEFAAFYAGVVTLSFFPAVTTFIEPNGGMDSLVFIALHFLVFNIGDLAGRPLASLESISQTNNTFLVVYSLSRTLFVPFFLRCNIEGSSNPAIVTSDVVYMLGLFLLGLTHGHCTTLSLVAASEGKNEEDGGSAARLTQFWMAAGLAAGGAASFGMYKIVWDVVI